MLVSTYQTGKVIILRADGNAVNTHFRDFPKPMGLTADANHITIGTTHEILELHNMPAVAAKLAPTGKHDACYLQRRTHTTGDIDIHEMAHSANELWFINTRFSCLCTLHPNYSFVPRWRPFFVSALSPEDRCHLNGLCLVAGQPRYVTALGETDTRENWRQNKANGGILLEVPTQRLILRELSMPHSPRWYANQLWLLESGQGTLAVVDPVHQQLRTIAQLPGFTRGLDFYGPLAFIGLSQVRESAMFSGIPLTERLEERVCGVWVVNIETGQTIAFLRFEDAVQEIFAVQVLPGIGFPEILESTHELFAQSYVLPDEALKDTTASVSSGTMLLVTT